MSFYSEFGGREDVNDSLSEVSKVNEKEEIRILPLHHPQHDATMMNRRRNVRGLNVHPKIHRSEPDVSIKGY